MQPLGTIWAHTHEIYLEPEAWTFIQSLRPRAARRLLDRIVERYTNVLCALADREQETIKECGPVSCGEAPAEPAESMRQLEPADSAPHVPGRPRR